MADRYLNFMDGANPQVVIIAGPNGAGKSTLAPSLLRDTFGLLEFVNADTISAGLSAFNSAAVAFDAGRLMLERLRELSLKEESFAFESTLASRSYAPWLRDLDKRGYEFHLLFLWLHSADLAVQRVNERVEHGGHAVNESIVRRRYYRGLTNLFELYVPLAVTWTIYDNSGGNPPVLIATGNREHERKIIRTDLWEVLMETRQ
jgi:predicted ABC-type ATPase